MLERCCCEQSQTFHYFLIWSQKRPGQLVWAYIRYSSRCGVTFECFVGNMRIRDGGVVAGACCRLPFEDRDERLAAASDALPIIRERFAAEIDRLPNVSDSGDSAICDEMLRTSTYSGIFSRVMGFASPGRADVLHPPSPSLLSGQHMSPCTFQGLHISIGFANSAGPACLVVWSVGCLLVWLLHRLLGWVVGWLVRCFGLGLVGGFLFLV